jgi:hypothetical protein
MKKLLVIANLYHSSPRIPGIMTYLTDYGWDITIITTQLEKDICDKLGFPREFQSKVRIIEAKYRGDSFWLFRKVLKFFGFKSGESMVEQIKQRARKTIHRTLIDVAVHWVHTFGAYPDTETLWYRPALKAIKELLKTEHFDAILSSTPHPTSHIIACEINRIYKIPWTAEFRDPWTRNHNYTHWVVRRYFEERLERKTIKNAKRLIAVTPLSIDRLKELHKQPMDLIYNGFDPENVNGNQDIILPKFTMTYTGLIYLGKQNPDIFLEALKNLINEGQIDRNKIEVSFYGQWLNHLDIKVADLGLSDIVKQYGVLPRKDAWEKQINTHVLLLFNWEDISQRGVHPSKLFEYMIARRPIIATGGYYGDHIEDKIKRTNIGLYAPSIDDIEVAIMKYYHQYIKYGNTRWEGNIAEINQYSYKELANKVASSLANILA